MGKDVLQRPTGWQLLRRNRAAFAGLWVLATMVAVALVVPPLLPDAVRLPSDATFLPPLSSADGVFYLFGTDINGKGLFYRVLTGARISIGVGLAAACVSLFIGTAYGILAGYIGGKTDQVMMRLVDVLYAVPRVLFIMVFVAAFDPQLRGLIDGWRQEAPAGSMVEEWLGRAIPYGC